MKPNDRVRKSPMWKYDEAVGTVVRVNKEYVIIEWDNINGVWHYTHTQAEDIEIID
jgi:hypothetical protein